MRRHGPMVLAVCRRVTAHSQDAEDAFQAAFLVLARKAGRLGPGDPVGGWLYGVAVRAARKAAARAWRRRAHETLVAAVPDVPDRAAEPFDPDAARAVVEEVGRLPEFLRAAVVLCELEGRSRAAAARELGIAEGTLSSRLAAARKRLARRLAARGFAPALLAPVAVPPALASAASELGSGAAASPAVAALAHGVGRAMTLHHFRPVALAAGLLTVAALAAGQPDAPRPAPAPLRVAAQPPAKKAAGPNRILVWQWGDIVSMDPDGGNRKVVLAKSRAPGINDLLALSPDGKRAVVSHWQVDRVVNYVYDFGRARPESDRDEIGGQATVAWSADGSELAVCTDLPGNEARAKSECFLFNPTTKVRTPLKWPVGHTLRDWSPDGRSFLTTVFAEERPTDSLFELWTVDRDGTPGGRLPACPKNALSGQYSPNGNRVLVTIWHPSGVVPQGKDAPGPPPAENLDKETELTVIDLATGRATPVRGIPPGGRPMWSGWSPDGSRIAYLWKKHHPPGIDPAVGTWTHLFVSDPDGGNARIVFSDRVQFRNQYALRNVEWR